MEAGGVRLDAVAAERAVFADAWAGKTRKPSHFRSWNCVKQGLLSRENVETITSVTFLSASEVKNIELVFQHIVEAIGDCGGDSSGDDSGDAFAGLGPLRYVTRLVPSTTYEDESQKKHRTVEMPREVIALTTKQLRAFLPELHHNVFLDRIVRVFSESGEQLLTLVELLDLYSTMSPRAPVEWKIRACFCIFDFDEDNRLGQRDLVRTIGRMVQGTHRTSNQAMSKEDAAVSIQRLYRGFQERSKASKKRGDDAGDKTQAAAVARALLSNPLASKAAGLFKGAREGGPRHDTAASITKKLKPDTGKLSKLDSFAFKMAEDCHSVQADAMDYPYFAQVMQSCEYFKDNFCISPINIDDLKKGHGEYLQEATSAEQVPGQPRRVWLSCSKTKHTQDQQVREDDGSDDEGDIMTNYSFASPTSPSSPRFLAGAPPEQIDDNSLRELAQKIWREHIARRRLSRLDGGMNVDGTLPYDEAVQMLVQNVMTEDGNLQKKLLPKHEDDGSPDEFVKEWLPGGSSSPRYRVGTGSVSKEQWAQYLLARVKPGPGELGPDGQDLLDPGGYSDKDRLWRNVDRIVRLHRLWPHWTRELAPETRKAPRWFQKSSYHDEPSLHYNTAKQILEKLWMTEWRHLRADDFCAFHERVVVALRNVIDGLNGSEVVAAKKCFEEWDFPQKCGGLSKGELMSGLAKILSISETSKINYQVDMLMHLIIDLDPHGPGYVSKEDFCDFFSLTGEEVRALAEAVVSTDVSSRREDADEREHEGVATAEAGSYDRERKRLRADARSVYVWSWPQFDRLFGVWWQERNPARKYTTEGSGLHSDKFIALSEFMKAWVGETLSDRMIHSAAMVNEEQDSQMCELLWNKMDDNDSGTILLSDAKDIIGNHIVCEHGHHFMALNARGGDAKNHQMIRDLFNRSMLELRLAALNIQIRDELKVLESNIRRTQAEMKRRETAVLAAVATNEDTAASISATPHAMPRTLSAASTEAAEQINQEMQQIKQRLKNFQKQMADRIRMRQDIHNQLNRQDVYDPDIRKQKYPEISEIDMPKQTLINTITAAEEARKTNLKKLELVDTENYQAIATRARDAGISELELQVAGLHIRTTHHKTLVKKAAFSSWWTKQRWLVKEYTWKFSQLALIWPRLVGTTGEENLKVWKIMSILIVMWDVERDIEVSVKARSVFHRRLVAWLHEYDRDSSGTISMDQFGIWFVAQSHNLVKRAVKYPWEELEIRFDRDAMIDEFGAMLGEVEREIESLADVDTEDERKERAKMSERELQLEQMLGDLDSEIHGQVVELTDLRDDRLKTREAIEEEIHHSSTTWIKVKSHQTAYGVLTGGARQPLLRTRLKLLRKLRSENHEALVALKRADSTKSFLGRVLHRVTKEDVKTDHALLHQSAYDDQETTLDKGAIATETVGEMMGDFFHVHRVRCCCDTYWVHDFNLWFKTHVFSWMERKFDSHLRTLERTFGFGVSEILRRAKFMIWLNFALSIIWLSVVIVPRNHRNGYGAWNTTQSVFRGIFDDSIDSQGSLFYDGYTKEPALWPPGLPPSWGWDGFPVRIDLLYFVCILLHVAMSLYTIMGHMGMSKMATGGITHVDSESRECAKLLGMYRMSVPNDSDEMQVRQRIRRKLDRWLQSYSEELQEKAMAWDGKDADCWTRLKFLAYDTKLLAGLLATGLVLVMHIGVISWTLIHEASFPHSIIPSLIISMLNVLVPFILKFIVKKEKHIRQTAELKALMYRIYAFKLVQLAVIMYSLGKISVAEEGSIYRYENTKSNVECPERQFGTTFLRLTCTDAVVFLATQYGYLYAVNYGLPKPNWKHVVWFFQTQADQARYKVLVKWRPCNRCCWKISPEELKLVPGRVAGTQWEIRATENDNEFEYVHIWSGKQFKKRTWKPQPLSLMQKLSGEHQEQEHTQWWARHHVEETHSSDDVVLVTFDPAHGYTGPMPIEFDFSSMYRKGGCCQPKVTKSPTIKRIKASDQGEDGMLDLLSPGMKLLGVNEDRLDHKPLSELSVRDLLELLDDRTQKISLKFEAVKIVHSTEAWATSQVMHNLTAGTVKSSELDMLAQLLVDAGYATKEDITVQTGLTPKKLYRAIARQRGKHRYKYKTPASRRKKLPEESPRTSSLIEPRRQYTAVLHMVKIEPICKMCTKTRASCSLSGRRMPDWCKECATNKVLSISAAKTVSKRQFRKYDTERGGHGTQLDQAELDPLIEALGIKDFRGLKAEGIDTSGEGTCDIEEFSAWYDLRQRRKALEARAKSCGLSEDQINSDGWQTASGVGQKKELDDQLIALIVEQSTCHDPVVAFDDGVERPVACEQECYVVLSTYAKSPELSYVLPKVDPQSAFDKLGVADLNAKNLQSLFKIMGVALPGRDAKFVAEAMNDMPGSEAGTVSFAAFCEWWKAKGAQQVLSAQSQATARVQMSKCKSVTTQQGGVDKLHIVIDTSEHIITFAVQRSEEALRIEAADANQVAWSTLLPMAVPDTQTAPIWGPDMQARTDLAIENLHHLTSTVDRSRRLHSLSSARQRDRSVRAAEQHIRNAYDFATGTPTAKRVMLREVFDQFDHDKSGALDAVEVKRMLKQLRTPAETIGHKDVKVKLKESEVDTIIREIEGGTDTGSNKMIEFDEFSAWWDNRVADRRERGLVEEHWSELRGRASLEFAAAVEIFNGMESRLKNSLFGLVEQTLGPTKDEIAVSAKHLGAAAKEADFQLLFKKYADERNCLDEEGALELLTHIRVQSDDPRAKHAIFPEEKRQKMWDKMKKKQHGKKTPTVDFTDFKTWWDGRSEFHQSIPDHPAEYWTVETPQRAKQLAEEQATLDIMELSDLRDRVTEIGLGEEAQHIIDEVVLAREKRDIVNWCKQAEEELSKKTNDLIPKRKSMNRTQALRCYEEALRLDETNPYLQDRVEVLTKQFNEATEALDKNKIRVFATQLIKYSGEWSEVTTEVNQQRLFKPNPKKIDAKYCAQLLIDIISRQSYVWVGSTWCPWLPIVAFFLQILMFWSLSHAMAGIRYGNLAPKRALVSSGSEWSARETKRTFMTLSFGALLVCAIPQLIWLNREPTCGPHSAQDYEDDDGTIVEGTHAAVFETFSVYLQWLDDRASENGDADFVSDEISVIASFFFNPPVLLIIISVLWTRLRYFETSYHVVAEELKKVTRAAEVEKKNFADEQKELIRRTVDTQSKYSNAVRQHLNSADTGAEKTPEKTVAARSVRTAAYTKSLSVLADQMQHEHDSRQLSTVNEATDNMVKEMFRKCSTLQGGPVEFDSLASAQPMLELASSLQAAGDANADDTANMLVGLSSLFIANISAHFATESHILEKVRGWTGENAVLACTVNRVSDGKTGDAEGGKYFYSSWALVTFVSQSYLAKVLGKLRAPPPSDPALQDIRGSWHAIPWSKAQDVYSHLEGLRGNLSVSESSTARNGAFIEAHNEKLRKAVKGGDVLYNSDDQHTASGGSNDKQDAGQAVIRNPLLQGEGDAEHTPAKKISMKQNATRQKAKGKRDKKANTQKIAVVNPMFHVDD